MRPPRRSLLVLLAASLAGCVAPPQPSVEAEGRVAATADGLAPVRHSGFRLGWIRPGDWAPRYEEVIGQYVGISYRSPPRFAADAPPGRDDYALPGEMAGLLMESLAAIFTAELGRPGGLRLASAAGPGVLRVRVALLDLVVHAPLARVAAEDLIWIDSAGELTVVIELRDATSDERLALLVERDHLARDGFGPVRGTPGPVAYEAGRLFGRWARNLRLLLDALRARGLSGQPPGALGRAGAPRELYAADLRQR